uniref:Uncharacterized protein n=1 Tax=Daucus carota subsp. sativus TaxID=79200 RepID=A0A165WJZ9_DAUCS
MIEQAVKNGDATKGNAQAVAFTAMKPMLFVEPPKANDAVLFYKSEMCGFSFGAKRRLIEPNDVVCLGRLDEQHRLHRRECHRLSVPFGSVSVLHSMFSHLSDCGERN